MKGDEIKEARWAAEVAWERFRAARKGSKKQEEAQVIHLAAVKRLSELLSEWGDKKG